MVIIWVMRLLLTTLAMTRAVFQFHGVVTRYMWRWLVLMESLCRNTVFGVRLAHITAESVLLTVFVADESMLSQRVRSLFARPSAHKVSMDISTIPVSPVFLVSSTLTEPPVVLVHLEVLNNDAMMLRLDVATDVVIWDIGLLAAHRTVLLGRVSLARPRPASSVTNLDTPLTNAPHKSQRSIPSRVRQLFLHQPRTYISKCAKRRLSRQLFLTNWYNSSPHLRHLSNPRKLRMPSRHLLSRG